MTEDTLKRLSLDELCELMILMIGEYTALQKEVHNSDTAEVKKAEIKLIKKVIDERVGKVNSTR